MPSASSPGSHHPDVAKPKEKAAAEEKFKQINEAYEVLSDPEKRSEIRPARRGLESAGGGFQPPPGWGQRAVQVADSAAMPGATGKESSSNSAGPGSVIFLKRSLAAGAASRLLAAARASAGAPATAERGQDVEADIMVTLEEALHGSKRQVSLRRAGSDKTETYQVKIPRGVHEGQRIRLAGQGEAGARGGKSGDLFLRVRLARHPDFSVEGSDLIYEAALEPWQAVLGTELEVPTLEGISPTKNSGRDPGRPAFSSA